MISATPAAGGGVWIRLRIRFGPRLTEWLLGLLTLGWGAVALISGDLFDQPGYIGFSIVFGDSLLLGIVMVALGIGRLGGLIVNGARKRVTPWIRVTSASIGFLIWVGMVAAHMLGGGVGEWAVFYPVFALAEIVNVFRAAHDAGESNGLP